MKELGLPIQNTSTLSPTTAAHGPSNKKHRSSSQGDLCSAPFVPGRSLTWHAQGIFGLQVQPPAIAGNTPSNPSHKFI